MKPVNSSDVKTSVNKLLLCDRVGLLLARIGRAISFGIPEFFLARPGFYGITNLISVTK
jgi:hypothetical protein